MKNGWNLRNLLNAGVAAAVVASAAIPASASGIKVTDAWFRALPAGLPAAGYFSLHNGGTFDIALIGAESPACARLTMHESVQTGGMSRMNGVAQVPASPGRTIIFAPGGFHLMCMNPNAAMRRGNKVPVTLVFAGVAPVRVAFVVKDAAGQ